MLVMYVEQGFRSSSNVDDKAETYPMRRKTTFGNQKVEAGRQGGDRTFSVKPTSDFLDDGAVQFDSGF